MTANPQSILYHPYLLELLLAQSITWRGVVGAANAADARNWIYYPFAEPDEDSDETDETVTHMPPRAIITDDADLAQWRMQQVAVGSWHIQGSTLGLGFDLVVPDATVANGAKQSGYWIAQTVGDILCDMKDLAGKGEAITGVSHLNMIAADKIEGPFELPYSEYNTNNVWHMSFSIEYR